MKKIMITSKDTATGFTGAVELVYGELLVGRAERPLLAMDLRGATLNEKQRCYLVANVPVYYGAGCEQAWGTDKLLITESELVLDFDTDFWEPYGHKVNRLRAEKEWNRLTKEQKALAVAALPAYQRYRARTGYRKPKDPENYLKQRMWETDWENLKE